MSNKKCFDRTFDIFIEDIFDATDEEIINEAIEDGLNIDHEVSSMKKILFKCKYGISRNIIEKDKKHKKILRSHAIDISLARQMVDSVFKKNPSLAQDITMAARFGENTPDEDVIEFYEDLCDLGLIDEKLDNNE